MKKIVRALVSPLGSALSPSHGQSIRAPRGRSEAREMSRVGNA